MSSKKRGSDNARRGSQNRRHENIPRGEKEESMSELFNMFDKDPIIAQQAVDLHTKKGKEVKKNSNDHVSNKKGKDNNFNKDRHKNDHRRDGRQNDSHQRKSIKDAGIEPVPLPKPNFMVPNYGVYRNSYMPATSPWESQMNFIEEKQNFGSSFGADVGIPTMQIPGLLYPNMFLQEMQANQLAYQPVMPNPYLSESSFLGAQYLGYPGYQTQPSPVKNIPPMSKNEFFKTYGIKVEFPGSYNHIEEPSSEKPTIIPKSTEGYSMIENLPKQMNHPKQINQPKQTSQPKQMNQSKQINPSYQKNQPNRKNQSNQKNKRNQKNQPNQKNQNTNEFTPYQPKGKNGKSKSSREHPIEYTPYYPKNIVK